MMFRRRSTGIPWKPMANRTSCQHWEKDVDEKMSIESGGTIAYYCARREKWAEKKSGGEMIAVEGMELDQE